MPRPAEWDIFTTAEAPELEGDDVQLATLPDGDASRRGRSTMRRLPQLKGETADLIVRNGEPAFFGLDPRGEYAVHAERLDGDFWEIQIGVLSVGTLGIRWRSSSVHSKKSFASAKAGGSSGSSSRPSSSARSRRTSSS